MSNEIKGLCLATRSKAYNPFLVPFLRHHLPWCEKAVVLLDRRPHETPDELTASVGEFGNKVVIYDWVSEPFSTVGSLNALSRAVEFHKDSCDIVMHLDSDEFVSQPEVLDGMVRSIRSGATDFAAGNMLCRFAPGGNLYSPHQQSYEDYCRVAPVRSWFLRAAQTSATVKSFLTRNPFILLHQWEANWKKDPFEMTLDHFRWFEGALEEQLKVKCAELARDKWLDLLAKGDRLVFFRGPSFFDSLEKGFEPHAYSIDGYCNYDDFYKYVVRQAPEGATMVEVGVCYGRSLSFMCEYATLLGKKLDIFGYDFFNAEYLAIMDSICPLPVHFADDDEWHSHVRDSLAKFSPWNTPHVIKEDSAKAAERHADKSVFFVWIDAGHEKEEAMRDIKAWLPKIQPGGILAGHDYNAIRSVNDALNELGFDFLPVSETSWMALL